MSLLYNSGKVRGVSEYNKVGYLCKMNFLSLFPPHFPPNLRE